MLGIRETGVKLWICFICVSRNRSSSSDYIYESYERYSGFVSIQYVFTS